MQEEEEEEMNRETNVVDIDIRLTKSVSQRDRQLLHPLELNDKLAFETIKTVRLDFLTGEAVPPIPRCQALPSHAFSRLTGRSILVALSHGWFFQTHPDPDGEKLNLIKNRFAPALRERYPNTDIQVFFDYLASPQRPRTAEEDKIFAIAMDRMNSMYVYADVTIFLEIKLPVLDMKIRTATNVDLSKYKFFDFVDTVQVSETSSKTGPQQFDCIQTCNGDDIKSSKELNLLTDIHTLTYLHRPFGRPNTIVNDDRGWLFLERITIAIKAAAAEPAQFDNIVVSNSDKLRLQIYKWSERLRDAASKQKTKPKALRDVLNHFDSVLGQKRFSFTSDEEVVRKLMKKLINQFASDWKGEAAKQSSMAKRAREILLSWGEFSEQYVERAGFLHDENFRDSTRLILYSIAIFICAPVVSVIPFVFDISMNPSEDIVLTALYHTVTFGMMIQSVGTSMSYSFANVPILSRHNAIAYIHKVVVAFVNIMIMRVVTGQFIVPFEAFANVLMFMYVMMPLERRFLKIIPVTDKRTNSVTYFTVEEYSDLPHGLLLNPATNENISRIGSTNLITMLFGFVRTSHSLLFSLPHTNKNSISHIIHKSHTGLPNSCWHILQLWCLGSNSHRSCVLCNASYV